MNLIQKLEASGQKSDSVEGELKAESKEGLGVESEND